MFEVAADGIVVVSIDGRIVEANTEAVRQFGYDKSELIGMPVEALVPEGARGGHERLREQFNSAPRSRPKGIGMELRGLRKDGSLFGGSSPTEAAGG